MGTNLSDLRESNEFLNLLLDNINSAVLIADENLQIHAFNNSFLNMFDRSTDQPVKTSFGQIAGCVNAVAENRPCGQTSQCQFCSIRRSLLDTLLKKAPVDRQRLERRFYIDGRPVTKYLEFSARPIQFRGRRMIMVMIHDITDLEERNIALETKQAQIDRDLAAAAEIQQSLLPHHAPDIPHIRTAWGFEPCDRVGGDIFQIYRTGERTISTYVLDVCGHGVPAALVAVTVTQFLQGLHNRMRLTGKLFSPAAVLDRLNKAFPLDRFDCFFTIVYASLNTNTGRLTYGNAGHVPPLVLKPHGHLDILADHGTVIGSGFDRGFHEASLYLAPGERLVLYSDGLTDNFGPQGEREGSARFHAALREMAPKPVGDLVPAILKRARDLRGDTATTDDISLLMVALAD
ncbi:MAG: SpoIIE family protein phosphatase [Desulfobacterales bacterium]|jgi:sigma-B regulation protein RsbU (phosphoserine phosphatase)